MPLDKFGHEVLDTTPVARAVSIARPPSIQEQIRRYVQTELSRQAVEAGEESFEEADDFDVGDEPELRSRYELDEEAASLPPFNEQAERRKAVEAAEKAFLERQGVLPLMEVAPTGNPVGAAAAGVEPEPAEVPAPPSSGRRRR